MGNSPDDIMGIMEEFKDFINNITSLIVLLSYVIIYLFIQFLIYSKFDRIVCVSKGCSDSFIKCFPTLINKVIVCENFTNINKVKQLSSSGRKYDKGKIRLQTA